MTINFIKCYSFYSYRFFDWSVSYPTAAHFIGYYNANCYQQETRSNTVSDDLSDLPLYLGCSSMVPETDFLDDITLDLDMITPMNTISDCELEDMGLNGLLLQQNNQKELLSLHYQLEEITASLLEKALRGW